MSLKNFFIRFISNKKEHNKYKLWINHNEPALNEIFQLKKEISKKFQYCPKISIITPVWNTDEKWLRYAIDSVMNQIYGNWELCLIDGGSTYQNVKKILTEYEKKDPRIKIKILSENRGIAENSNEALSLATGEFVGFLDHDDILAPFALYEVVKLLNYNQNFKFIYSDEDKIDEKGNRKYPFFKPDWSPDQFLSQNYLCHFTIISKKLVDSVGGFRTGYDGSQDYDLFLRCIEKISSNDIAHIPKILYHWRINKGSAANNPAAKPYASISAKKALEDSLIRRNLKGEVIDGLFPSTYRIRYAINNNPRISILISTKDNIKNFKRCINSILEKTEYKNYEIVIIDCRNSKNETLLFYHSLKNYEPIKIIQYNKPFNSSSINNFAVTNIDSPYIVFLNENTEVISTEWLSAMLEHAQRESVGAVGAKLLYPNNQIEHAGIILGINGIQNQKGIAGHSSKYLPNDDSGYFSSPHIVRNYSAVTSACLMMRKELFQEVGGFDENLAIAYNDLDLCLKLRRKGYLIVYTPYAQLYLKESVHREKFIHEITYIQKKWGDVIDAGDPYYNSNLTLENENFSIK